MMCETTEMWRPHTVCGHRVLGGHHAKDHILTHRFGHSAFTRNPVQSSTFNPRWQNEGLPSASSPQTAPSFLLRSSADNLMDCYHYFKVTDYFKSCQLFDDVVSSARKFGGSSHVLAKSCLLVLGAQTVRLLPSLRFLVLADETFITSPPVFTVKSTQIWVVLLFVVMRHILFFLARGRSLLHVWL